MVSVAAAASTVPSVRNRAIPAAAELSYSAPHGSCAVPLIAHDPCGAEVAAVESEGGCWTADPSAASTVTSGDDADPSAASTVTSGDDTASESSAAARIVRFWTLGTVLAAAATLTM